MSERGSAGRVGNRATTGFGRGSVMGATSNDGRAWLVSMSLRVAGMTLGLLFLILLTATAASAQSAELVVTKTDTPDPVNAGNEITYTITVTNAGPNNAQNATATDQIPTNTTLVSATQSQGTLSSDGTTITANFGTITAFSTASL